MEGNKLIIKEGCKHRFERAVDALSKVIENSKGKPVFIAIDGKCASGKTTLAYYLKEKFQCNLFHMDDFFLQKNQRTEKRLSEIGGNVDYERFKAEVIEPLKEGREVTYRKFSCRDMEIVDSSIIPFSKVNIIEGSYSMHPYFGEIYDLKIFMDINEELQLENIRKRNGEEKLEQFKSMWIPKENAYFEKFNIKEHCIIINWEK